MLHRILNIIVGLRLDVDYTMVYCHVIVFLRVLKRSNTPISA